MTTDEWVGTNTQNFPRDGGFRECLVPPPGCLLAMTDFGALELVTFAQVQLDMFGRSALAEILRAGMCPHSAFGAKLLAIPYESFDKKRPEHNAARQLGKAWNFGKPGGMGEARFIEWAWTAYEIRVTPEQNKRYDAEWHASFPEVRMFWDRIKRTMQTGVDEFHRPIYTVVQPRTGRIRSGCGFPDACNTHFQGLGADVAGRAAWLLYAASRDVRSPLHGCRQLLFEHDAFATAVPISRASEACAEQERLMIQASRELCPDVPMKVESKIADRYCK